MRISPQEASIGFVVLLLLAAFLLALYSIFVPPGGRPPWAAWFAPKEDGSWVAASIDGYPVPPGEYRISITDGKVSGGRDGCNDWGYTDDPPNAAGERMILSTLQACPEEDPTRGAYYVIRSQPKIELLAANRLRVSGGGHHGIFSRCEWKNWRDSGPGYSSEVRTCVPVE